MKYLKFESINSVSDILYKDINTNLINSQCHNTHLKIPASLKPCVRVQSQSSEATYVALVTPHVGTKSCTAAVAIKY